MLSDAPSDPKIEIAHVLTMDLVEYSTLLITEQTRVMGATISARGSGAIAQCPPIHRSGETNRLGPGQGYSA
jgi:hypothetical protein